MCKSSLHRECLQCGTDISDKRSTAKYCSTACRNEANYSRDYQRQYKRDNYDSDKARDNQFKVKYGISLQERDAMYAEQEGRCKVCEQHMTLDSRNPTSAHVDHCHTSGEVKGLLCSNCNTAAGLLGENHEIALKLAAYLLDTGKIPTR